MNFLKNSETLHLKMKVIRFLQIQTTKRDFDFIAAITVFEGLEVCIHDWIINFINFKLFLIMNLQKSMNCFVDYLKVESP